MKKKLTYGPRDVDDISWALFCVPHCMALYPSPAPSVLPRACHPPHRAPLPPFWFVVVRLRLCPCCHLVVVVLVEFLVVGVRRLIPAVVVVVICPLVVGVGVVL